MNEEEVVIELSEEEDSIYIELSEEEDSTDIELSEDEDEDFTDIELSEDGDEDFTDIDGPPKMPSPKEIRIIRDLINLKNEGKNDLGFTADPYHEMINVLEVRIFKFDKNDPIYNDMEQYKQRTGRDYIEMRVSFPPDYPESPPFVRIVAPRFVNRTGNITFGGSVCSKVLTLSNEGGWNPNYDLTNIIISLVSEMMDCNPKLRIDWNRQDPYYKEEAIDAYLRVADVHRWEKSDFHKWTPL